MGHGASLTDGTSTWSTTMSAMDHLYRWSWRVSPNYSGNRVRLLRRNDERRQGNRIGSRGKAWRFDGRARAHDRKGDGYSPTPGKDDPGPQTLHRDSGQEVCPGRGLVYPRSHAWSSS